MYVDWLWQAKHDFGFYNMLTVYILTDHDNDYVNININNIGKES